MNISSTEVRGLRGAKIRVSYRGVTLEGWVVSATSTEFLRLGAEGSEMSVWSVAWSRVEEYEVLERPEPQDTYPVGAVVRWRTGGDAQFSAVKRGGDYWFGGGGGRLTWAELLQRRPLTVLAESATIE